MKVAPQVKDLTGLKLGDYEIVSLLGVGGMGAVYEGRHPLIGKRVAVKVLLPQFSADPGLVERFLAEARSVNEIRHRNIVDIFSFGQLPDGSHYFLMEFLEGQGFEQIIHQRAPLPAHEALFWCEEVLEALGAAHEFGIIHRDVKPSNIFMVQPRTGKRYVKLLDFGVAKLMKGATGKQTLASVVVGTPFYMSPEQARGRAIGPATDLYALGCVLFEMLTGRTLFIAETATQVMFMHAEDSPPLASSFNPAVPPAVEALLQSTLRKDPAARPQTADELRNRCEQIRLQLSTDTSFTAGLPRTASGDGFRSEVTSPRGLRATPFPTDPSADQAPDDGLGPTLVRPSRPEVPPAQPFPGFSPGPLPPASVVPSLNLSPGISSPPPAASSVAPRSSRLPLVLGGGAVLVLGVVGWALTRAAPEPLLVAAPPVAIAPQVEPAVPAPTSAQVSVPAPSQVGAPAASAAPIREGVSADQLEKRLTNLERRLKKKEAKTGEVDGVLRQFLARARADARVADTESKRRSVWRFLDDIKRQLDGQ